MLTAHNTNIVAPIPSVEPFKQVEIGRIRNVGSSVATIAINKSVIRNNQLNLAQIGTILKIVTHKSVVVAMVSSLRIGSEDDVAKVRIDDLLSKHFAIIGSTGSGKSCTVALVLQAILEKNPMGHIVLFDPHNEYSKSFGDRAEVINQESLDLERETSL